MTHLQLAALHTLLTMWQDTGALSYTDVPKETRLLLLQSQRDIETILESVQVSFPEN